MGMSKKRSNGTPKVTQMSFTMSMPGAVSPVSQREIACRVT